MLNQIFDLDYHAHEGDYVVLRLKRVSTNESFVACVGRFRSQDFLFSNKNNYNGWHTSAARYFCELGYAYAWYLTDGEATFRGAIRALHNMDLIVVRVQTSLEEECCAFDFISDNYTRGRRYCGFHGYHTHSRDSFNEPKISGSHYLIGCEIETEFKNPSFRREFVEKVSNWFYCERDGSLNGDTGCEIVTIPLLPTDARDVKFWAKLTDYLKQYAGVNRRCGFHVHIGRGIFGEDDSEHLGKLLYLYHHFIDGTRLNRVVFGRDKGYHAEDGKTSTGDSAKSLGSKVFKYPSVKDKVSSAMISKSVRSRYFDINITNDNTIEFRKGAGTIEPERIVTIVEYCELMCKYAKKTTWTNLSYEGFVEFIQKNAKGESLIKITKKNK